MEIDLSNKKLNQSLNESEEKKVLDLSINGNFNNNDQNLLFNESYLKMHQKQ